MNVSLAFVFDVAVQRYSGVAAISIVAYDIRKRGFVFGLNEVLIVSPQVITLDNEIQHFWGRSLSPMQVIYFLNRYYGLLVVVIYLYGDMVQTVSNDLCRGIVRFGAWSGWTMILLADVIMAIRVHALFGRTKVVTLFLGSLYLAQGLAMMGMLIGYDQRFDEFAWPELQACGLIAPAWFGFFWIPTLVFEFILLCMTLFKAMVHGFPIITGETVIYRRFSLYRILVRDQIIYFVSILFSGCANIALWSQLKNGTPNNEGITLSVAMPCVLGGRILMSLREAAAQQDRVFDDAEADTSALVF